MESRRNTVEAGNFLVASRRPEVGWRSPYIACINGFKACPLDDPRIPPMNDELLDRLAIRDLTDHRAVRRDGKPIDPT